MWGDAVTQDNAAKADEIMTLGRQAFGDEWAVKAEETCSEVTFTRDTPHDGYVCDLCGAFMTHIGARRRHVDYHRLLSVGIWFAMTSATVRLAFTLDPDFDKQDPGSAGPPQGDT